VRKPESWLSPRGLTPALQPGTIARTIQWRTLMGYRDDFYCVDNIIGYSGSLHEFPTVYFLTSKEYGHITQEHGYGQNVGRQEVGDAAGYSIGNESVNGVLKLLEKKNGRVFHESRTTLTKVTKNDADAFAVCSQAVWKYQDEKYISNFSKDVRDDIKATDKAKKALNKEIRRGPLGLEHVPPSMMKGSGA
jgi:hypothetical protein